MFLIFIASYISSPKAYKLNWYFLIFFESSVSCISVFSFVFSKSQYHCISIFILSFLFIFPSNFSESFSNVSALTISSSSFNALKCRFCGFSFTLIKFILYFYFLFVSNKILKLPDVPGAIFSFTHVSLFTVFIKSICFISILLKLTLNT